MPSRRKEDFKKHGDKYVYVSSNFNKQFSIKDDTVETIVEVPIDEDKVEIKIDIPLEEPKNKQFKKKKKNKGINLSVDETVTDDHD